MVDKSDAREEETPRDKAKPAKVPEKPERDDLPKDGERVRRFG